MNIRQRTEELQTRYLNINPKQIILWKDSMTSVGFYTAALLLMPLALITGAVGALIGALSSRPQQGFKAGAIAVIAPAAILFSLTLGLPFAFISLFSRKYHDNAKIDPIVAKFKSVSDRLVKQQIIDTIIANDDANKTGYRSMYSFALKALLKNGKSINLKWQSLHTYLTLRDGAAYLNNGKKLFTATLDAIAIASNPKPPAVKIHEEAAQKVELAILCANICHDRLATQGIRLFSFNPVVPTGILYLRECLTKNGINIQNPVADILKLTADEVKDVTTQLRMYAESRGPAIYFRSEYVDKLYTSVVNAGYNSCDTLLQLGLDHQQVSKLARGEKKFDDVIALTEREPVRENHVFGYGRVI